MRCNPTLFLCSEGIRGHGQNQNDKGKDHDRTCTEYGVCFTSGRLHEWKRLKAGGLRLQNSVP